MKRCLITILLYLLFKPAFTQVETRSLTVYCITEYIDGYIIKGIDNLKGDTLSILSFKDTIPATTDCEKIIVGGKYNFRYEDRKNKIAAIAPCTMVIRIKTTVVWDCNDRIEDMPVFSKNVVGLVIKRE